jgi:hypothetical protein
MTSLDQLDNLQRIQQESEQQSLPQQQKVIAVVKLAEIRGEETIDSVRADP